MGGLLGNPLGFIRLLTSADDLNNLKDGIYSSVNADDPDNNYSTNTLYIQMTTLTRDDVWQIALSANAYGIAVRVKTNLGQWSDWNSVITIS